jgi:hypothetical protein
MQLQSCQDKQLSDDCDRYTLRGEFVALDVTIVTAGPSSGKKFLLDLATGQGLYIGVHRNRGEGEGEDGEDGRKGTVEMHYGMSRQG